MNEFGICTGFEGEDEFVMHLVSILTEFDKIQYIERDETVQIVLENKVVKEFKISRHCWFNYWVPSLNKASSLLESDNLFETVISD